MIHHEERLSLEFGSIEINLIGLFSCLADERMENGKVRVQPKREKLLHHKQMPLI